MVACVLLKTVNLAQGNTSNSIMFVQSIKSPHHSTGSSLCWDGFTSSDLPH